MGECAPWSAIVFVAYHTKLHRVCPSLRNRHHVERLLPGASDKLEICFRRRPERGRSLHSLHIYRSARLFEGRRGSIQSLRLADHPDGKSAQLGLLGYRQELSSEASVLSGMHGWIAGLRLWPESSLRRPAQYANPGPGCQKLQGKMRGDGWLQGLCSVAAGLRGQWPPMLPEDERRRDVLGRILRLPWQHGTIRGVWTTGDRDVGTLRWHRTSHRRVATRLLCRCRCLRAAGGSVSLAVSVCCHRTIRESRHCFFHTLRPRRAKIPLYFYNSLRPSAGRISIETR